MLLGLGSCQLKWEACFTLWSDSHSASHALCVLGIRIMGCCPKFLESLVGVGCTHTIDEYYSWYYFTEGKTL